MYLNIIFYQEQSKKKEKEKKGNKVTTPVHSPNK